MSVKKKLLIALLSATCFTAGACGLAACKEKPNKPTDDDNKNNDSGYVVTAKDDKGNPVAGAWFEIGYMDSTEFVNVSVDGKILAAQTDGNGKAEFKFTPEAGKTYSAKTADPANINDARPVPYGYLNEQSYVQFKSGETTAEYQFKYVPNNFYYNESKQLDYKRVYDAQSGGAKEEKGENKWSLEKNRHSYFYLLTYKEVGGETAAEIAENQTNYTVAASGKYEVSFKAVEASVTLYSFYGGGYVSCDAEGIPSYKTQTVTSSSQSITLNLTVNGNQARMPNYFGIYADKDCEIEIEVKRVGDATEPNTDVETTEFEFTAPTEKFNDSADKLTPVPIPNSRTFVKDGDGFYHIGSADGPLLLMTLTSKLERIGELSLQELPSYKDKFVDNAQIFIFSDYDGDILTARTDYTKLIEEYSKWVNSDGVYPVNDDLYSFLQRFQQYSGLDPNNRKDTWLIPCQFYADANGIAAEGDGSVENPFVLIEAVNKLSNTGASANLSFTASKDGAYAFVVKNGEVSTANGVKIDGVTYVAVKKGQTVKLALTGSIANNNVTVTSEDNAALIAEFGDGSPIYDENDPEKIIGYNTGKGVSEETAVKAFGGVSAFVIDKSVYEDGVWVYFSPLESGKFQFETLGSASAQIVYDGNTYDAATPLKIDCEGGKKYAMLLTAKSGGVVTDGAYLLNIYKNNKLEAGEKLDFTLNVAESYTPELFTFTVPADGWYKFELPDDTTIESIVLWQGYTEIPIFDSFDGSCDSFYAEEGAELEFDITCYEAGEVSFSITVGEAPVPPSVGGTATIKTGSEFELELEAGTYEFEIDGESMAINQNKIIFTVGEGAEAQQIELGQGVRSGEVTVAASGVYKVTVEAQNAFMPINLELTITAK